MLVFKEILESGKFKVFELLAFELLRKMLELGEFKMFKQGL